MINDNFNCKDNVIESKYKSTIKIKAKKLNLIFKLNQDIKIEA